MNILLSELNYNEYEFHNYSSFQAYIDMVLLPLVKNGDYSALESAVVAINKDGEEILYNEDSWLCSDVFQNDESSKSFHFAKLNSPKAILLKNQIKSLAILLMYTGKIRSFSSTVRIITDIRNLSLMLISKNIFTLDKLDLDLLIELADEFEEFTSGAFISSLNCLILSTPALAFSTKVNQRLTDKVLEVELSNPEQYLVTPPRIYKDLLTSLTKKINDASLNIEDIVQGCKTILSCQNEFKTSRYNAFLEGKTSFNGLIATDSRERVVTAFNEVNIDITSNQKPTKDILIEVLESCKPQLNSQYIYLKQVFERRDIDFITVGKKQYQASGEFMDYVREVVSICRVLILAYTGMRINELKKLSPNHAIQNTIIDGQTIYQITTRQSKIKKGTQTKNDVFITNEIGYGAAKLLNTIMQVFREQNPANLNHFNISLKRLYFLTPMSKPSLVTTTNGFLNNLNHGVDLTLTQEDMQYIQMSNPNQKKAKVTKLLILTNHMFRRSLAYYLIGYELLAFPMLKEQLSHVSSAMTRWYARNAASFQRFNAEIQKERIMQQSKILARIYQKIANNERISGGKGKAINHIVDNNNNYFEESTNSRLLEEEYWSRLIQSNKAHIHAILPGVYCTNSNCDMRVSIELAESIDCEFVLTEEAFSIEAIRINSMKNILVLHETNELSHSSLSHFAMKIKAAEKILDDMNFNYHPFEIPEEILNHNISIANL